MILTGPVKFPGSDDVPDDIIIDLTLPPQWLTNQNRDDDDSIVNINSDNVDD